MVNKAKRTIKKALEAKVILRRSQPPWRRTSSSILLLLLLLVLLLLLLLLPPEQGTWGLAEAHSALKNRKEYSAFSAITNECEEKACNEPGSKFEDRFLGFFLRFEVWF